MEKLKTEFIKLDSFLKMAEVASTGGQAKQMVAAGEVYVNGELELRRGRKLYPGDTVKTGERTFKVG